MFEFEPKDADELDDIQDLLDEFEELLDSEDPIGDVVGGSEDSEKMDWEVDKADEPDGTGGDVGEWKNVEKMVDELKGVGGMLDDPKEVGEATNEPDGVGGMVDGPKKLGEVTNESDGMGGVVDEMGDPNDEEGVLDGPKEVREATNESDGMGGVVDEMDDPNDEGEATNEPDSMGRVVDEMGDPKGEEGMSDDPKEVGEATNEPDSMGRVVDEMDGPNDEGGVLDGPKEVGEVTNEPDSMGRVVDEMGDPKGEEGMIDDPKEVGEVTNEPDSMGRVVDETGDPKGEEGMIDDPKEVGEVTNGSRDVQEVEEAADDAKEREKVIDGNDELKGPVGMSSTYEHGVVYASPAPVSQFLERKHTASRADNTMDNAVNIDRPGTTPCCRICGTLKPGGVRSVQTKWSNVRVKGMAYRACQSCYRKQVPSRNRMKVILNGDRLQLVNLTDAERCEYHNRRAGVQKALRVKPTKVQCDGFWPKSFDKYAANTTIMVGDLGFRFAVVNCNIVKGTIIGRYGGPCPRFTHGRRSVRLYWNGAFTQVCADEHWSGYIQETAGAVNVRINGDGVIEVVSDIVATPGNPTTLKKQDPVFAKKPVAWPVH